MIGILDIEELSLGLGIAVAAGGLIVGYKRRYQSHQFQVFRDIIFLALMVVELVFFVIEMGLEILLGIFLAFYVFGYYAADPRDWIGISTYSEDMNESFDRELMHYVVSGKQRTTEQTMSSAVKNLFGVHDVLDADLTTIRKTRSSGFSRRGRKKRELSVAAVAQYDITWETETNPTRGTRKIKDELGNKTRVPKTKISSYRKHKVVFANCSTTDPISFDVTAEFREEILNLYLASEEKNLRLEVLNKGLIEEQAARRVANIFELDIDKGNIAEDTIENLDAEMLRRRNISSTAAKILAIKPEEVTTDAGAEEAVSPGISG